MRNWRKSFGVIGIALLMGINTMAATNNIGVKYNGNTIELTQTPKMINNSVLLPIRAISESLGYVVNYDSATKKIEVVDGSYKVVLYIGKKTALINDKEMELVAAPQMIEGVTYVPLRFVAEAMEMGVNWNSKLSQVELESKYTIDQENEKLMVRTADGKKVMADVPLYKDMMVDYCDINMNRTEAGSEIVCVCQMIQGALTNTASTIYYIKEGKVIETVIQEPSVIGDSSVLAHKDKVYISNENGIKIYDDTIGKCIKTLDIGGFDIRHVSDNYIIGYYGNTTHVIDLVNGKTVKILDAIANEQDREMVYMSDMPFMMDQITVAWLEEDTIVFKYFSDTEQKDKTITYKVGVGII